MTQQVSPFLEGKYGWNYGESGWNNGMDENLVKFSYMFDRNVISIVSSLPTLTDGQAYFLTTDNRFYFRVGGNNYSCPAPKWFTFYIKSTGQAFQFNGTTTVAVASSSDLSTRIDSVENTLDTLGTAAFQDVDFFATQSELDIASAGSASYTDQLRTDLTTQAGTTLGAYQVGYKGRTVGARLEEQVQLSDYPTIKDALATGKTVSVPAGTTLPTITTSDSTSVLPKLDMVNPESALTINLASGVHTTTTGNIVNVGLSGSKITLLGATPSTTTLTSIASVSGSSGAYSVTLNVASASGVAVGNYLKLDNVVPLLTLSGDNSVFRIRVAQNELLRTSALLGNITANTGGGSAAWASVSSGVLSDYISVGDLLTIKGQTRPIATVAASSVTITGAWSLGVTSSRDYFVSRPNSGTVGTGGVDSATVIGVSSLFTTEANVGDLLLADGKMVAITAITNNTSLTVSPAINLAASTPYSIITTGVAHEGTHEVTAVSGTQITVLNKWRGPFAPPVNRVSGGEVKCISTILKNTGSGDGFYFNEGSSLAFINNLVIVSTVGSTGTHGLALNGRPPEGPTQLGSIGTTSCGDGVAISGWGRGAFLGLGCQLQARRSHFSGNTSFGIWALEGSTLGIRECVISGTSAAGAKGVYLNAGTLALITDSQIVGNNGDGLTVLDGATVYGEIPNFYANIGMNVRITSTAGFHVNEGVNGYAGQSGIFGVGAHAEISRCLFVANAREGIELSEGCMVIANGISVTGSRGTTGSGRAIVNTNSRVLASDMSAVGNVGSPVVTSGAVAAFEAPSSWIRGTVGGGVITTLMGKSRLTGGKPEAVSATLGSTVLIDSVSPVPTITGPVRINETANDGSLVTDGAATGFGVNSLRVNGVAVQTPTFFNKVTQTFDFPSIAAGGQSTTDITVTGALTSGHTATAASNSIPTGIILSAYIPSANTVRVIAYNPTTGALDPGNATLTVTVIG